MIREDVLARLRNEPWAKLWSVNVIVHEGVVELWGIVDTAAEKRAIRVVAEATPGVREVIDHDDLIVLLDQNPAGLSRNRTSWPATPLPFSTVLPAIIIWNSIFDDFDLKLSSTCCHARPKHQSGCCGNRMTRISSWYQIWTGVPGGNVALISADPQSKVYGWPGLPPGETSSARLETEERMMKIAVLGIDLGKNV